MYQSHSCDSQKKLKRNVTNYRVSETMRTILFRNTDDDNDDQPQQQLSFPTPSEYRSQAQKISYHSPRFSQFDRGGLLIVVVGISLSPFWTMSKALHVLILTPLEERADIEPTSFPHLQHQHLNPNISSSNSPSSLTLEGSNTVLEKDDPGRPEQSQNRTGGWISAWGMKKIGRSMYLRRIRLQNDTEWVGVFWEGKDELILRWARPMLPTNVILSQAQTS